MVNTNKFNGQEFEFACIGNNGLLTIWTYRYSEDPDTLEAEDIMVPQCLENVNLISAAFTHVLPAPVKAQYLVIGTQEGNLFTFDMEKKQYVDLNPKQKVLDGSQIGCISVRHDTIVIAGSGGKLLQYPINGS